MTYNLITKGLITNDNWKDFCEECNHPQVFGYYLEATERFNTELKDRLDRSTDFNSLRNEILQLISDRQEFLIYAEKNLP